MKSQKSPLLKMQLRRLRKMARHKLGLVYAKTAVWIPEIYPNFLGIGAPRSASTWLHHRLSLHPQIFLSHIKEVHFFDSGFRLKGSFDYNLNDPSHWRWYAFHFLKAQGQIIGDITPAYSSLPEERIAEIANHLPKIKIIYILRNPIERAWSEMRKGIWFGKGITSSDMPVEYFIQKAMSPQILIQGDYKRNIQIWERYVPKDRIHYLFYDGIKKNPRHELENICEFLNINPELLPDSEGDQRLVNSVPAGDIPMQVREILENYYKDQLQYLENKFQRDLSHWFRRDFNT